MNAEQQPKQTLFDISAELAQIETALDSYMDTPDEEAESNLAAVIATYFEGLKEKRDEKLEAYAGLISTYKAHHKIRKEEADRLAALAKSDEAKQKRLQKMLDTVFEQFGLDKVSTKYHNFGRQNHGGVLALKVSPEVENDPKLAQPQHQKVVIELDTAAIRRDLEAGATIPYAEFAPRGWSVRIR